MRRRVFQWCLVLVAVVTVGLGWKYPLLGFVVPAVMLAGFVGGMIRGRYVCGNLCPRGSLFDRLISPISRKRAIPTFLRNMRFRWVLFAALMGFMVFRVSRNPTDVRHWGYTFWLMCTITTGIGVSLGVLYHPRIWCAFCPMGTVQNALGGGKRQIEMDSDACIECGLCERVCPLGLAIVKHKEDGRLQDRDCARCSECVASCPKGALSWPTGK